MIPSHRARLKIEQVRAGSGNPERAAAIELNVYYLADEPLSPARHAEQWCVELLAAVRTAVHIPVAVKIGPYFSSPGEMARMPDLTGADGLVLFNRFMQTRIDPTSALLRHGPGYATQLLDGLSAWPERKGFASVAEARGLLSARAGLPTPGRSGYLLAVGQATRAFT